MQNQMKQITFLLALVLSVQAGLAYDAVSHRAITAIAYENLSKKARKHSDQLLGTKGIIYTSTWADEIRSDATYAYSYKWHFQNLKDSMTRADIEKLWHDNTSEGEHLFFAIDQLKNRLKQNKNDAEALKFLVHFMGDLHQPMHLGRASDLGGNKIEVRWFGRTTNLHSVWDGSLTESRNMSYTEYAQYLTHIFSKQHPQFVNETQLDALYNVYNLRNEIYATDEKSNYKYIYKFGSRNDEMIYRAGIQLAKTLNELFR